MTGWGWALVGVAGFLVVFVVGWMSWRRGVRRRFVTWLATRRPDLRVTAESSLCLRLRGPDEAEVVMNLFNLYQAASRVRPEEEATIFEEFVSAFEEQEREMNAPLTLASHGERLLPRLVPRGTYDEGGLVRAPLESLGLDIVYVIDGKSSVRYLTAKDQDELGIDRERLHALSLENLRRTFPDEKMRGALEGQALAVVKLGDTHDAARLLLLPSCLEPDQVAAAAIPDRDTLVFCCAGADFDWQKLAQASRPGGGSQRLLDGVVKVTSAGFERA